MKLWEGNVFTSVCLSTGVGTRSLLGLGMFRGGYVHGEDMSRVRVCPWGGYVHEVGMFRGWVCP